MGERDRKKTIGIGYQDFERIRTGEIFYIDKTDFIRQWWEAKDQVTADHPPQAIRKDPEHDHPGEILFHGLCGKGRFVPGAFYLGRRNIPEAAGDVSGDLSQLREREGQKLRSDARADLSSHDRPL